MCKTIVKILILMLFGLTVFAQPMLTLPKYRQYTLRDGLSQMQVTAMMQDSRGYLWVGTKMGLNCYNGEHFVNYTSRKFPEMENDHITKICEDNKGRIWASTLQGIVRIDGKTLKNFRVVSNPAPYITCDDQGRLWFTKYNYPDPEISINIIDGDSIQELPYKLHSGQKLPHLDLAFCAKDNALLIANDTVLYRFKNKIWEPIYKSSKQINFYSTKKGIWFNETCLSGLENEEISNFDLFQYYT